jgi:hypothetical protein
MNDDELFQIASCDGMNEDDKAKLHKMNVVFDKLCKLLKLQSDAIEMWSDEDATKAVNDYVKELTIFFTNLK